MKVLNKVLLLSFIQINTVFTMELSSLKRPSKWFVEFNKNELEFYAGNDSCFGDKYRAQCLHDGKTVLFPVKSTEVLPIRWCGNTRYFITNPTSKKKGKAYIITDDTIKQLAFVRGITESNGYGFDLYMGLKTDDYVTYNYGDRIYPAVMMCVLIKARDSKNVDRYQRYIMEKKYIKPFVVDNIRLEIAQDWLRKDIDLHDPAFRAKASELLGEQAKKFNFEKEKFVLPALSKISG